MTQKLQTHKPCNRAVQCGDRRHKASIARQRKNATFTIEEQAYAVLSVWRNGRGRPYIEYDLNQVESDEVLLRVALKMNAGEKLESGIADERWAMIFAIATDEEVQIITGHPVVYPELPTKQEKELRREAVTRWENAWFNVA